MIQASLGNVYSSSKLQNSVSVGVVPSAESQQRPAATEKQLLWKTAVLVQCEGTVFCHPVKTAGTTAQRAGTCGDMS